MRRQLAILAVLVAVLVFADGYLRGVARSNRLEASLLMPLVDPRAEVVPERIRTIVVQQGSRPQSWTYELRGRSWRYPAYFNAHVRGDRIDLLLRSLLQSAGTKVSDEAADHGHFGLTSESALRVGLSDGSGVRLLDVWVGRGAPGPRAGESYVRLAGDDAVVHLHANPSHALAGGWRAAPILDPYVLPRSLVRRAVTRLNFITAGHGVPESLWRVAVAPDTSRPYVPRPGGPEYRWLAGASEGGQDSCRTENVYAYTAFLRRLRYDELHDLKGDYGFAADRRLELIDEEGVVNVLEVGRQNADGGLFLRNLSAGIVCTISPDKATLLFPLLQEALIDSLDRPSPYELAEPGGRP